LSSVIVFDSTKTEAEALRERILDAAWQRREAFVYQPEPLAESIARAKTLDDYPVLLIDHGDNCGAGGTQDDMTVAAEVIKQGLKDVAVGAICDPQAVNEMIGAGVGARVTVSLGGKTDSPAIKHRGMPLEITGFVRTITDGQFTITGPMATGVKVRLGKTVVLDSGTIQFIVIERRHEPMDLGLFRSVGIEPTQKKYLLLKSRLHYRAGFAPIARHIVECAGLGVASSDYSLFPFQKLKRPIYPLDAM
jgi:microcystin degradation protein MlrC